MAEAQKLSEVLNKYDSKNILHGHVMSIIQNDIELELFSDKRHSKNRFCSFTVTAGDGSQAFKDRVFIGFVLFLVGRTRIPTVKLKIPEKLFF